MKTKLRIVSGTLAALMLFSSANLSFAAEAVDPKSAEGFVLLADAVPDVIQEIRYYSTYNFVGERIDGYEEPCALITEEAAESLRDRVASQHPDCDIELQYGGQPIYYYIVSAE